jgi:hypothetical protein
LKRFHTGKSFFLIKKIGLRDQMQFQMAMPAVEIARSTLFIASNGATEVKGLVEVA